MNSFPRRSTAPTISSIPAWRAVLGEVFTLEVVKALAVPAIRARIAAVFMVMFCTVIIVG